MKKRQVVITGAGACGLMAAIMAARNGADNYKVQNECDSDNLFEVVEQMGKESAELRRHPEVNAYLDAELALCKMMQRICIKLGEGIDIEVPGM